MALRDPAQQYETGMEAAGFLDASGDSARAAKIRERMASLLGSNPGIDQGLDIADFSGQIDPTQARGAIGYLSRMAGRAADRRGGDSDRARNRTGIKLNKSIDDLNVANQLRTDTATWNDKMAPTFDAGLDRLNELAGTAAISAEQEQMLRSNVAGQVRTAKQQNLSQVGAMFGLRGMSNSPAAAALASHTAESYDAQLVSQLRDMGLQVSEMNREQARKDTAAATTLATLRGQAEKAYLAHDQEAFQAIGRETAALIDALYTRDQTFNLYEKQMKEATDESLADRLGQWVNIARGVAGIAGSFAGLGGGGATPTAASQPFAGSVASGSVGYR